MTTDDDGTKHATRRGTAVELEIDGQKFWVLSVHLKSSCATTKSVDRSKAKACKILWQQSKPLKQWIASRTLAGEKFIIAGDFNRRFRQFRDTGPFWKEINGGDLAQPLMKKYPETASRKCPNKKGSSTQPIDWIMVSKNLVSKNLVSKNLVSKVTDGSFFETRFSKEDTKAFRGKLSDHCPIHIDLEF